MTTQITSEAEKQPLQRQPFEPLRPKRRYNDRHDHEPADHDQAVQLPAHPARAKHQRMKRSRQPHRIYPEVLAATQMQPRHRTPSDLLGDLTALFRPLTMPRRERELPRAI